MCVWLFVYFSSSSTCVYLCVRTGDCPVLAMLNAELQRLKDLEREEERRQRELERQRRIAHLQMRERRATSIQQWYRLCKAKQRANGGLVLLRWLEVMPKRYVYVGAPTDTLNDVWLH